MGNDEEFRKKLEASFPTFILAKARRYAGGVVALTVLLGLLPTLTGSPATPVFQGLAICSGVVALPGIYMLWRYGGTPAAEAKSESRD